MFSLCISQAHAILHIHNMCLLQKILSLMCSVGENPPSVSVRISEPGHLGDSLSHSHAPICLLFGREGKCSEGYARVDASKTYLTLQILNRCPIGTYSNRTGLHNISQVTWLTRSWILLTRSNAPCHDVLLVVIFNYLSVKFHWMGMPNKAYCMLGHVLKHDLF